MDEDVSCLLLLLNHGCLSNSMLPSMRIMNSGTMKPNKCFIVFVMVSLHSTRKITKTEDGARNQACCDRPDYALSCNNVETLRLWTMKVVEQYTQM